MGALLCALDVVVVATALPALQADFGASLSQLKWTVKGLFKGLPQPVNLFIV